jgi:transposase-like protein
MSDTHYTEEFKFEAIKQITEQGHSVCEVSQQFGVPSPSFIHG